MSNGRQKTKNWFASYEIPESPHIVKKIYSMVYRRKSRTGFSFIELLITLAIIAICFLPLMRMFTTGIEQVYGLNSISTARYLAQLGMEEMKNSGFTQAQLEETGDAWQPDIDTPPYFINGKYWRIQRKVMRGSDPLEVHVLVYETSEKSTRSANDVPLVDLVTLVEDLDWSPAS